MNGSIGAGASPNSRPSADWNNPRPIASDEVGCLQSHPATRPGSQRLVHCADTEAPPSCEQQLQARSLETPRLSSNNSRDRKTPLAHLGERGHDSRTSSLHYQSTGTIPQPLISCPQRHHEDQHVPRRIATTVTPFLLAVFCLTPCDARSPRAPDTSDAATAADTYLLRYKFTAGEVVRWKVTHKARTDTEIRGSSQTAESNSESTKVWTVKKVGENGEFTLVHSVSQVNMWQRVGDEPLIHYDSKSDEEVPRVYQQTAKTVGVPLSTVTISPPGAILAQSSTKPIDLGLGSIVIPFPEKPIKIGDGWNVPRVVTVSLPIDGVRTYKKIKVRQRYTLRSVKAGIATIAVRTEVITPVRDARIESQLIQKMIKGSMRFDLQKGRLRSKTIDWNEHVLGFQGANSNMKYRATFSEQLLSAKLAAAPQKQRR